MSEAAARWKEDQHVPPVVYCDRCGVPMRNGSNLPMRLVAMFPNLCQRCGPSMIYKTGEYSYATWGDSHA